MNFDITKYILKKIDSGEWPVNFRLPTEQELINKSGLSKMTIRKSINKLKDMEILYTIQGNGVYVSSFNKMTRTNSFEKDNRISNSTILPTKSDVPDKLLEMIDNSDDFKKVNKTPYVKIYFKNDEVFAYTVGWVRNENGNITFEYLVKNANNLHKNDNFEKIIKISRMERSTQNDKNILQINDNYIPTTYSFYFNKNRKIQLIKVIKIKPKYFNSFEIEYNQIYFE